MPQESNVSFFTAVRRHAFAEVDIASLVFFRIVFGVTNVGLVARVLWQDLLGPWWANAPFLFKYAGFSWVKPWPGYWLELHWIALGIFAFFIAIGFLYRINTILFFVSHCYFFLLDQGRYVNHLYLIGLFGFLFIFVPAHRTFSIDAWLNKNLRAQTVAALGLWLFRIQMAAVYFFAGVAKLTPDWLQGEPMRVWLQNANFGIFDRFMHAPWAALAGSYGAMLLDLFLAPLLLWRRTRVPAFCAAVIFHLLNARLFELDIFPWFAIGATTLFFPPSWPRRIFRLPSPKKSAPVFQRNQTVVLSLAAIYVAIQVLVPLRNFLHRGGAEWRCVEHRFSWQMMLHRHTITTYFYVTDPATGREVRVRPGEYLRRQQVSRMGWRPDMVRQFAHYLADRFPQSSAEPLQVVVRMFVSINGRKPTLVFDPTVDLAAEPRTWGRPKWLREIHDPLPPPGEDFSGEPYSSKSDAEQ